MTTLKVGDRVRMTTAGKEVFRPDKTGAADTGVVVGYGRSGGVRIVRDGAKTPMLWTESFWERDDEQECCGCPAPVHCLNAGACQQSSASPPPSQTQGER